MRGHSCRPGDRAGAELRQVPLGEVAQLYDDARARLEVGARVGGFLGIFAIRNVRKMLRQRSAGTSKAARDRF